MKRGYFAPALLGAVGIALLIYMVLVESEPGLVPLVLIAAGIGWALIVRDRSRSQRK